MNQVLEASSKEHIKAKQDKDMIVVKLAYCVAKILLSSSEINRLKRQQDEDLQNRKIQSSKYSLHSGIQCWKSTRESAESLRKAALGSDGSYNRKRRILESNTGIRGSSKNALPKDVEILGFQRICAESMFIFAIKRIFSRFLSLVLMFALGTD
ncbi:hypothetical protein BB561_000074 [Smittium simulii]|uniref:Uncharacterized protein n=1 Tax=Smittium simulii TaxID=133385 RepID=A0A2T9Z0S2_9FUNG|nr:hypothetical protein BB561_000074 [Smittium simulii]